MKTRTITIEQAAQRLSEITGGTVSERRARALRQSGKLGATWDEVARRWLCSENDIAVCAQNIDTKRRRKEESAAVSRTTKWRRGKLAGAQA